MRLKKWPGKQILHLDMDAFFASIEQAANPKLKDKPVIVGSRNNKYRTVVAACSYEAKAKGCASGMSAQEALRLCPEAVFIPADCTKYIYTAQEIYSLLKDFSPQVEMASIDEFYLDITDCTRIFGSIEAMASLIKEKIRKRFAITGSVGIAANRLMAKLASKMRKPDGLVIWQTKDIPNILKELPVEKICGIGAKITAYLNQMSIFTCGQLASASEASLVKRFGKYGCWLKKIARGEDSDLVDLFTQAELPPKSVGHSYTLEMDVRNPDLIQSWIRMLCEMVAVRLRKLLLEGSVVHLYLRSPNLQWWSRQKKFATYTFDGQRLYQRCLVILKSLLLQNKAIRALGVSVSGLAPASSVYLFVQEKERADLLFVLDRINRRFGDWTIHPARLKHLG